MNRTRASACCAGTGRPLRCRRPSHVAQSTARSCRIAAPAPQRRLLPTAHHPPAHHAPVCQRGRGPSEADSGARNAPLHARPSQQQPRIRTRPRTHGQREQNTVGAVPQACAQQSQRCPTRPHISTRRQPPAQQPGPACSSNARGRTRAEPKTAKRQTRRRSNRSEQRTGKNTRKELTETNESSTSNEQSTNAPTSGAMQRGQVGPRGRRAASVEHQAAAQDGAVTSGCGTGREERAGETASWQRRRLATVMPRTEEERGG